jgi:collagenase-like PrtC family protease
MKKVIAPKKKSASSRLTLGPLFFHWPADKRRDFYLRIADEAPVDTVYLGEVVCSKREPFFEEFLPEISDRLRAAGKEVVLSTLALVTSERERKAIEEHAEAGGLVEANDVACLQALHKKPHIIGPFINVFNESARDFVLRNKATRIVLPVETPAHSIEVIAAKKNVEIEVMVFGRQPLAVAMRCYSARAHGLNKDTCQFVCGLDADGMPVDTLDGQSILTVNGTQTLSHGYVVLLNELVKLQMMGVSHFRLSPQNIDMVSAARLYRSVLDKKMAPDEATSQLKKLTGNTPFINGFFHAREGLAWDEGKRKRIAADNY